ncbi:PLP-dependent transferase [Ceraceosorus guamensis]|uniref:PLP-dependent transferase n=1 Tax=Ceraceosorus guamensis TaxID=1522189 RepID=A0A316W4P5_9BASI|nr:PLP-dependent transferase [Ceraceosorus guamensis]PWN42585.1 PLP-dependent transferase [Ceraceosorus guamensis]
MALPRPHASSSSQPSAPPLARSSQPSAPPLARSSQPSATPLPPAAPTSGHHVAPASSSTSSRTEPTATALAPPARDPADDHAVGTSVPPATAHAVSVSLPKWQDNVDYEEGKLGDVMETGYPRFFIHRLVQKLAALMLRKFGGASGDVEEQCLLVPSARVAERCRQFMLSQWALTASSASATPSIRVVEYRIQPSAAPPTPTSSAASINPCGAAPHDYMLLYIVLFPSSVWSLAKSYWQHTGDGISSRFAQDVLARLDVDGAAMTATDQQNALNVRTANDAQAHGAAPLVEIPAPRARNRHYARSNSSSGALASMSTSGTLLPPSPTALRLTNDVDASADQVAYLEERYARVLPSSMGDLAKAALRRRIAGTLLIDRDGTASQTDVSATADTLRTGTNLDEKDVFLLPSGMSAIFHAHQTALRWKRAQMTGQTTGEASPTNLGRSVCFGFPYLDTLKILQKWGDGALFYGHGTSSDLADLESALQSMDTKPLALFCEFPSNPLLRSPDLNRLRQLADQYGFLIVVDETIGNFLNVEVLPYADIVVSSLTKVFSGDTNVMGGSLVLNPRSKHAALLRQVFEQEYEDTYYGGDACVMERNSRNFAKRVVRINENAEALADFLYEERGRGVITDVFYPKYVTRDAYDACRRKTPLLPADEASANGCTTSAAADKQGRYGGLLSITFETPKHAQVFYDNLDVAKGPSLGSNFTLASPYAILAHYTELDWAAEYGVPASLVRVSTGLEQPDDLLATFTRALLKAARIRVR